MQTFYLFVVMMGAVACAGVGRVDGMVGQAAAGRGQAVLAPRRTSSRNGAGGSVGTRSSREDFRAARWSQDGLNSNENLFTLLTLYGGDGDVETLEARDSPRFRGKAVPLGTGKCFGLVEQMCQPCPAPEQNDCDRVKTQCDNLFCSPACLTNTFSCSIKGKGDFASISKAEQQALCGQVIGHACSSKFECCSKDSASFLDWVEFKSMDGAHPLLPIQACKHDPKDEAAAKKKCNDCMTQIEFEFNPTLDRCHFGSEPMPESTEEEAGVGAMKSYQEQCLSEARKVMGQGGSLLTDFSGAKGGKSQLCVCAGCCAPDDPKETCYFPITEIIR